MTQTESRITNTQYQDALRQLLRDTKGMRENVDAGLEKFKDAAYPHSERAIQMLVDEGYLDRNLQPTPGKGTMLEQIHEVFFSHLGDNERVMSDGVRVLWDALCECYVLAPEERNTAK